MTSRYGKARRSFLERAVLGHLGAPNKGVVVGPGVGFDNAVLRLGGGRVLVICTDPVSIVPSLGIETSAWLSVHLVASDFTTSGCSPSYATFSFNFPAEMGSESQAEYLESVSRECRRLGVGIVAGHTGSYPGGSFTVVGSGSMLGLARKGQYVDPSMSREGDRILITKGAGLEATATLALAFPKRTIDKVGSRLARKAMKMVRQCSTVEDALSARKTGLGSEGVSSMHDATEGGLLGGLEEMAFASNKAFWVDLDEVGVPKEAAAVCSAYGLDPMTALSEGTLLITCNPAIAWDLKERMTREGIPAFDIGSIRKGSGLWVARKGGRRTRFKAREDSYWKTYASGVEAGWT